MLLWVMGVGFENTCTVPGKWNVFKVISRLYGWVDETLKLNPLAIEHRVVVMTAGSHQEDSKLNPMGSQFSIPDLWNFSSELVRT